MSAFSKAPLYNEEDRITSEFFFALSHPARLQILRQLIKDGPTKVHILQKNHPISQPSMSQHLEILRKVKLVNYKEKYPYTIYSVNGKYLTLAETYLKRFFDFGSIKQK